MKQAPVIDPPAGAKRGRRTRKAPSAVAAPPPSVRRTPPAPPLPRLTGTGRLDRGDVLSELPGELGVVLWRASRAVSLWAQSPAAERVGLFGTAAAEAFAAHLRAARPPEPLVAPLAVMAALYRDPAGADVPRLVNACRRVQEWADGVGLRVAALEFAQGAALAAPDSPLLACGVARLARRMAEYPLADAWLDYALKSARRLEDWRAYATACSGKGNLQHQLGSFARARAHHQRALRTARHHALDRNRALALHDLFAISAEMGAQEEAERYAEEALEAYGPRSPKLPRLGYDIVYFWMLNGRFAEALALATALPAHFHTAAEKLLVHGAIARAAGGAGAREAFDTARADIERLAAADAACDGVPGALLGLAHGAATLEDWELARETAFRARHAADERRQGKVSLDAESVLAQATARQNRRPAAVAPPEHSTLPAALARALARAEAGPETDPELVAVTSPTPWRALPARL